MKTISVISMYLSGAGDRGGGRLTLFSILLESTLDFCSPRLGSNLDFSFPRLGSTLDFRSQRLGPTSVFLDSKTWPKPAFLFAKAWGHSYHPKPGPILVPMFSQDSCQALPKAVM
ncbi:Protein of unknown function [Cotesia congregata]|uniref:Uncharacterized protein n=1 Tax=Cotesia congregata TaxID=51543 RepID=A0A8J2MU34_COTCN|nr:Protein of unknown function [Cotesia congregata]